MTKIEKNKLYNFNIRTNNDGYVTLDELVNGTQVFLSYHYDYLNPELYNPNLKFHIDFIPRLTHSVTGRVYTITQNVGANCITLINDGSLFLRDY